MSNLGKINNDLGGFQNLISFYEQNKNKLFGDISLNINAFFAANMSASLGAILEKLTLNVNNIHLSINNQTEPILRKNKFLTFYGYDVLCDSNNTTIPFSKFGRSESKKFTEYVMNELITRQGMPVMSPALKIRIRSAIGEIFANASMHTDSPFIFACGQFYPALNFIDFTIADMGEGIRNEVNKFLLNNKTSTEAIKWALVDGNTTKINTPGGYGLTILKELIGLNKGMLQIVSNDGFYEFKNGNNEEYKSLQGEFPGTVVNLQFRTNDTTSYALKNEK